MSSGSIHVSPRCTAGHANAVSSVTTGAVVAEARVRVRRSSWRVGPDRPAGEDGATADAAGGGGEVGRGEVGVLPDRGEAATPAGDRDERPHLEHAVGALAAHAEAFVGADEQEVEVAEDGADLLTSGDHSGDGGRAQH